MDDIDLTGLRTKAASSSNQLATLTESAPKMLNDLRSSLTQVFSKDNPLIQERDQALSTFLSTPANTRSQLLPQNLPQVEGSFLNLSPTQQNAIVTSRSNAALAPLLGLNQAVTAGYGGIGDIVSGAGTGLQALVQAEKIRADQAQQAFQNALAQQEEARLGATSNTGFDLSSILSLIGGFQQPQTIDYNAILDEIDQKYTSPQKPEAGTTFSQPLAENSPGLWERALGFLGATPRQDQNTETPFGRSLSSSDLNLSKTSLPLFKNSNSQFRL